MRSLAKLAFLPAMLAAGAAIGGCSSLESKPQPPVEVVVRVMSDPDRPVEGAKLSVSGKEAGTTDGDGIGRLRFNGRDGETYEVRVTCPAGFRSPERPTSIVLRRLVSATKTAQYEVACPPDARTVVVAVRAENGPNLPVYFLGREVARTDAAGAAHVLLKIKEDEQFALMLKTDESKEHERLKPQSPQTTFAIKRQDEVLVFDQKFEVSPLPAVRRGPVRRGPTRIR